MKTIRQWWTDRKDESRRVELENIKSDFAVAEKNGKIYLTHRGYAFAVMPKDATTADIAVKITEARKAAVEFE